MAKLINLFGSPTHSLEPIPICYSVIDSRFPVSPDLWVISLLHQTEHTFIFVEGMNAFLKIVIRRYEFTQDHQSSKGKIIIYPERILAPIQTKDKLKILLNDQPTQGQSWAISVNNAKQLHSIMLSHQNLPPDYDNTYYHGFTWARERLMNLDPERIEIPSSLAQFLMHANHIE